MRTSEFPSLATFSHFRISMNTSSPPSCIVHVCTHTQFSGATPERLVAAIKYFLQGKGAQKGLRWEEGRKDGEGVGGGEEGWGRGGRRGGRMGKGEGGEGWRGWEKGRRMGEGEEGKRMGEGEEGKRMERGGRRGGRMEVVEGGEKDEGRVGEGWREGGREGSGE